MTDLARSRWNVGAVLALLVVLAYILGAGWGLVIGRLDVSSYLAGFAPAVGLVMRGVPELLGVAPAASD